jgi:hypothetical protein
VAYRLAGIGKTMTVGLLALLVAQILTPAGARAVARSTSVAVPEPAQPLLPNLRVLRARDVYIARSGTERKLRFEAGLASVGAGPIEVRPNRRRACPEGQRHASQVMYRDVDGSGRYKRDVDTDIARRSAGCMVFHPYHDHWHFEAASRYTLYEAERPRASQVAQRKMSFCLRDSRRVPENFGTYSYPQSYGACSRYSPQGISIGWVDVYQSYLAGQAIRLPARMGDGLYCLRIDVDPKNQLVETRDDDNRSLRAFVLRGDRVRYRDSARCRVSG